MSRYLLGTFLAALAMFIWGAVFWISPFPYRCFATANPDAAAGAALLKYFPESGTYLIPGLQHDEATLKALREKGPLATVHIRTTGAPAMEAKTFVLGLVHYWVSTLLAAFLAVRAVPAVSVSFGKRLWFFVLIGVLVAVFTDLAVPIWWLQPWPYHLVNAVYHASAWLVGGLVLASAIKPRPQD